MKLGNNKNNNRKQNKRKPKGEGWRPLLAHKFESKCSVQPAVCTWPFPPPTPHSRVPLPLARSRWQGHPLQHPQNPAFPFLLTGALLPQSSEMERRLKMGRRRPGSRLGDSEPLRLPELREPLK